VVKHGREIVIVGHTDCLVCKTSVTQLIADFQSLGIPRSQLPENLHEYFGLFASERQNVIRAVDFVRSSPLIGPHIPVHGLLLDIVSGRLEWVVNGYEKLDQTVTRQPATISPLPRIGETGPEISTGEIKAPEVKIGETSPEVGKWLAQVSVLSTQPEAMPDLPNTPPVLSTAELTKHFNQARRYLVVGSDHRVYGPILGTKVLEWIAEGRLDWDSEARFDNSNHWVKLADLVERRS
jgi:carbonic anhydrase